MKTGRLLSMKQLAKEWGWKPARLYRLVSQHAIPHLRIGPRRDVYFEEHVVNEWLAAQRKAPQPSANEKAVARAGARSREQEAFELLGIEPGTNRFA